MAPTQGVFLKAVRRELGLTQAALGRLLGWTNAYSDAHKAETETKPLRYDETMKLLEECGWLKTEAWTHLAAEASEDAEKKLGPLPRGRWAPGNRAPAQSRRESQ